MSIQDNAKLLQQLKSGPKSTINWNKYQTKVSTEGVNPYLDFLIDPGFQGVNKIFVLSFENESDTNIHRGYYLPKIEIKDYNVMIERKNFLISRLKMISDHMVIFKKFQLGQGDDYMQLVVC